METYSHKISASPIAMLSLSPRRLFKGNSLMFSAKHRTTYFPPKKRNGAKECARRVKQGLAPSCYVHDYQYPYYRQLLARCKREAAAMDHMV